MKREFLVTTPAEVRSYRIFAKSRPKSAVGRIFLRQTAFHRLFIEADIWSRVLGNKVLAALESDGPELFTLLVRLTLRADLAEDLLQDLFVKLSGGNSIKGVHDPRAYIRRMAINLAFDWRRSRDLRERRMNSHQTSRDEEIPAWLKISQHEQAERILSVAAELSELQRQAFALRFVHDESFEQIGRTLGRTAHQARGLCHAAVVEIRKRMAQTEHNFANG